MTVLPTGMLSDVRRSQHGVICTIDITRYVVRSLLIHYDAKFCFAFVLCSQCAYDRCLYPLLVAVLHCDTRDDMVLLPCICEIGKHTMGINKKMNKNKNK